jgi:leader peptidase (prepilin peptidase) / N-methyltransferase
MNDALVGVAVVVVGLLAGVALNWLIERQVRTDVVIASGSGGRVPVVGALGRRDWVALAVEALTALMALVLWQRYGLSVRSLFLFGASLVLINTGAVDFRIRMIDTLVMVVATVVALAFAPVNDTSWLNAVIGTAVATVVFLFFFLLAKLLFPGHAAPFGLGDVYLAAFIGALSGLLDLPTALFYGIAMAGVVALGLIIARGLGQQVPTYIAYGTYLCLGALLYIAIAD